MDEKIKIKRYDVILKLIKDIKNPIGVEVGIWKGTTFFKLLKENEDLYLYGVDPYKTFKGGDVLEGKDQKYWNDLYINIKNKSKKYKDRCKIYRDTSIEVAKKFLNDNKKFDFVFIDGDHKMVEEDIDAWYPLVKDNGILCGHDYIHHILGDYVKKIVDEKFSDRKIYTGPNKTWWVYK